MSRGTVLVADDDGAIRTVLNQALSRAGFDVRVTSNIATLWRWISEGQGDVVVSDILMPDGDAFDLLPRISESRPDLPVIVMSAQNTFMTAVRASEAGAYEYLPKPFDLTELTKTVEQAFNEPKDNRTAERFDQYLQDMPLVGRSAAMQEIYRAIARIMQTDLPVMIAGEHGTGKHLAARIVHDFGTRKDNPFESVDLATLPADTIETELFGTVSGGDGSTGGQAGRSATGTLRRADGGTLFLDEICELPLSAQSRLLGVLQTGRYAPVGDATFIKTDVRLIAASSRDMDEQIRQGKFREDLYYRLNVFPLRLPPLRERIEDVPDLVRHFLKLFELEGGGAKHADADAMQAFKAHSWPGNVLELENLIKRVCTLYPQETITGRMIETEIRNSGYFRKRTSEETSTGFNGLRSATEYFVKRYYSEYGEALPEPGVYHRFLAEFERPLIIAALEATNGNQIRAAENLGLNRNTLRKKIRDHGITITKTTR